MSAFSFGKHCADEVDLGAKRRFFRRTQRGGFPRSARIREVRARRPRRRYLQSGEARQRRHFHHAGEIARGVRIGAAMLLLDFAKLATASEVVRCRHL